MNKLRRLRSLSPEMAETLRLAGVQGIFWAAMAVGNYQSLPAKHRLSRYGFRLIKRHCLCRRYFCHDVLGHGERPYRQRAQNCHFNADARLRPFHFCATHSDGAILLDSVISNLDPDHQLFPRTDVAVCR